MSLELQRATQMIGVVFQCIALGLTPSSAFLIAAMMLRSIERREGCLGERNPRLEAFVTGLVA